MIRIQYANLNREPCNISGTPVELRQIKKTIEDLAKAGEGSILIPADPQGDSRPYDKLLTALKISIGVGPTRVSISSDVISANGAPENLEAFASFFDFADDADLLDHSHYEYFEGNRWIDAESIPLVIGIKR